MLDTARPGMPVVDVVRGGGWPGHARGVERHGAALSRSHGSHLRSTCHRGRPAGMASPDRPCICGWANTSKEGLAGLADHSHRPRFQPRQLARRRRGDDLPAAGCAPAVGTAKAGVRARQRPAWHRCRPGPRSTGCWSAAAWSRPVSASAAARTTSAGSARRRCSCGSWTSPGRCS